MKRVIFIIAIVCSTASFFDVKADVVTIAWQTQLDILPGMEGEMPNGVIQGQTISGSFTYDLGTGPVSHSNETPWTIANYPTLSWQMDFGNGHTYSRELDDGHWSLGRGSVQIRNRIDEYNDRLGFGCSIAPHSNINDFIFSLVLQDNDRNVWDTAYLPLDIPLSEFEIIELKIRKIKIGTPGSNVVVAQYNGLDEFELNIIPEPATLALLTLGGLVLRRRRA